MLVRNKRKGSLSPILKIQIFLDADFLDFLVPAVSSLLNEINNIAVLVSFICLQLKSDSKRESSEAPRPKAMH